MAADPNAYVGHSDQAHHHHHGMPNGHQHAGLPRASGEEYAPRGTDAPIPTPKHECMPPTWWGFIHTTFDALILLEACLLGTLTHIPRRPHDRERDNIIQSGNVFIYEENASGIKRWTDGITWSPSRIMGNFLVYRELDAPFPAGEKKKAKKRKRSASEDGQNQAQYSEEDRKLIGSLVDSYGFKPGGLIKKTLNVKYQGINHHIVAYYSLEDVKAGVYKRPKHSIELVEIVPRDELVQASSFKVNPIESDDESVEFDPRYAGVVDQGHYMLSHPPRLSVSTQGYALRTPDHAFPQVPGTALPHSPASSMTTSHTNTPVDYFVHPTNGLPVHGLPHSGQTVHGLVDGLTYMPARGVRMDSVIGSQQPHFKTEGPEMPDMPDMRVFTAGGNGVSPITPGSANVAPGQPEYYHAMNPTNGWAVPSSVYGDSMSMSYPKRVNTGTPITAPHGLQDGQDFVANAQAMMAYNPQGHFAQQTYQGHERYEGQPSFDGHHSYEVQPGYDARQNYAGLQGLSSHQAQGGAQQGQHGYQSPLEHGDPQTYM